MAFVSPVFVRTVQTSSFGGASAALVRASPASKRKGLLVRPDRFSSLAMASDSPLRMEDVCFVGRKRDPKTGNISGRVYVVGDNIDTDQIIPAEHLSLLPSVPTEYQLLGSHALEGLPKETYPQRYLDEGELHAKYPIIVAGENFGCGSSREHAPIALGAAGAKAVVACSFARIFFRNCSSTGELYPWISKKRLVDRFKTGDEAMIDFEKPCIRNLSTGEEFELEPLGEVQPVIDAGGLFEYARRTGMIKSRPGSS
ncbi:hypothetical protein CCYA_CCYA04G1225 [Cyanidiococcus yangmingshanensis]|nr:hypothetical protein CCYA_CCYA04G1225 [Cyanidiococcus yangmingshanensis]